jgi:hypothetical protein
MSKSQYSLNEDYFEKIDTEEKAYFLGLLYADGCNNEKTLVRISLQEEDREILEKLNESIGSNRPIYRAIKGGNRKPQCSLYFFSKKLSDDLRKLGCIKHKSLKKKFPLEQDIPSNLLRHFLRGYYDGNGSFTTYKSNFNFSIHSTYQFCLSLQQIIKYVLGLNSSVFKTPHNDINGTLSIGGRLNVTKIMDWMYDDTNLYLQRKHDKFKNHSDKVSTVMEAKLISAFGETKRLSDWSKDNRCVVTQELLRARIKNCGWEPERAMTTRKGVYEQKT